MANTKETILDTLVTAMGNLTGVQIATRILELPSDTRLKEPYIGVIGGEEVKLVEDSTEILWSLQVDLIVIKRGTDVEQLVDLIKNAIYTPINLGAAVKHTHVTGTQEVALVKQDKFSSTRLVLDITYVSTKGAA